MTEIGAQERRLWLLWLIIVGIEAAFCGGLAALQVGSFEILWSLETLWRMVRLVTFFIAYGIGAVLLTLAALAAWYALRGY